MEAEQVFHKRKHKLKYCHINCPTKGSDYLNIKNPKEVFSVESELLGN